MDTIVTMAIVGTGQLSGKDVTTATPVDTLAAQLPADDAERKLLLTAGAWSLYRQAGRQTKPAPEVPVPAAEESLPVCSTTAANLLESLLQKEHDEVLPEALERLKQLGQRLPYELLPQALSYGAQSKDIRAALISVIGERGRWLGQFNPGWSWVAQFLAGDTLPDDAETIWQEGTIGQRSEILRQLRAVDAAKARDWLNAVWKQEKAEARNKFLATFKTGLSAEDEGFLEKALDDRSEGVRTTAAELLARIPASALAQRMLVRADAILTYANGIFKLKEPKEIDNTWQRDGIPPAPKSSKDNTWYQLQVLSLIPPTHWEERFAATPDALIKAAKAHKRKNDLLLCWSYATMLHQTSSWAFLLWQWLCEHRDRGTVRDMYASEIHAALTGMVSQAEAEAYLLQYPADSEQWQTALPTMTGTWSQAFAEHYLQSLRNAVASIKEKMQPVNAWSATLTNAARSLPPACFEAAMEPLELPEAKDWQIHYWRHELDTFIELVRTRKRILEEII